MIKHKYKIFLVDDDVLFCRAAQKRLDLLGFSTAVFHDSDQLFERLDSDAPDLVLLDLALGRDDGHITCRKLRAISAVPIIILTGHESADMIVSCLEAGADDYVVKPFNFDELSARMRAVLRRRDPVPAGNSQKTACLSYATLNLDIITSILSGELGSCQLSDSEAALLAALVGAAPATVDREQLSRVALRRGWSAGDRTIDVLIGRLRKKITHIATLVDIATVRGAGYALRESAVMRKS